MTEPNDLSLEQQFNLASFENQVKGLTAQQSQEMLVALYRQMLVKKNLYKRIMKTRFFSMLEGENSESQTS